MSSNAGVPSGLTYTKSVLKVTLFSEFHVWRVVWGYLSAIGALFLSLPICLVQVKSSPEHKHGASVFISFVLAFAFVYIIGLDLGWGTRLLSESRFSWKLWSVYTSLMILLKFLLKVNKFTHQIIRGAIRSNRSLILPTLCHTISNVLGYWCLTGVVGTYLAGLFDRSRNFVAACWHIQGALAELFFPELLSARAGDREALSRVFMIVALCWSTTYESSITILLQPLLEFSYAFVRYFIVSMSGDADAFFAALKKDATAAPADTLSSSIIIRMPVEAVGICFLSTAVFSPIAGGVAIGACLVAFVVTSLFHRK